MRVKRKPRQENTCEDENSEVEEENGKVKGKEGKLLYDVRPISVGLVPAGANRKAFFLMKGEGKMANQTQVNDELDELEAALAEAEEEAEETPPADEEKDRPSILAQLFKRRARDPLKAAQHALKIISGHPELNNAASFLLRFIQERGGSKYSEPDHGEAYPEPGAHSVAKATDQPPVNFDEIKSTLSQLDARLAAIEPRLAAIEQKFAELEKAKGVAEVQPIAKSLGLNPEVLLKLKEEDPNGFNTFVTKANIIAKSDYFGELGTGEQPTDMTEQLFQRANEISANEKIHITDALVRAAKELQITI